MLIAEITSAIVDAYHEEVMESPTTPDDWMVIANNSRKWQYHHCLGVMYGKHVAIRKPMNACSYYYNYKNFHSIVLMALVVGDYKFTWMEVSANDTSSDAQIFEDCGLKAAIDQRLIGFPPLDRLPDDDKDTPYFFVGDNAFPLCTYMMKPYGRLGLEVPERIYNYYMSRCQRVSENAFGILANRYACLLSVIKFQPKITTNIVLAAICCHNLMRMRYPAILNATMDHEDDQNNVIPGDCHRGNTWEQEIQCIHDNRETKAGKQLREYLKHYYISSAGAVTWQLDMI